LQALAALVGLDPAAAAGLLPSVLGKVPQGDPSELTRAFLARKTGPALLTKTLNGNRLTKDHAKIILRTIDASGRKLPVLVSAVRTAGGLTTGPLKLSAKQMKELVAEINTRGDAKRGEVIYRRKTLGCLACHAIGGAGGRVGPDLVSLGASAPVDYIADSLLNPNGKVKENYHSLVVATKAGKVITGIKLRQSDTELVLRDARDREISVPLKSIEEQVVGTSLMPAGLTEILTRAELVDLARFLSVLGKPGPYAVSRRRVARRWQALSDTPQARFRLRRTRDGQAATADPAFRWEPRYATVAGVVPLDDLPVLVVGKRRLSFARCEIEVITAGRVAIAVGETAGLSAWLGDEPLTLESVTQRELPVGRHRLTLAIDPADRSTPLHLELVETTTANARFVTGK
ncbi:MAG: sorbosone dehydrogenase, partial [Planctomycetaceae bacterium]